jgi:DNA repair exonuclease SbcCD ATPase subunit
MGIQITIFDNILPDSKRMKTELDLSKFDNPAIQVVWEDNQENFTQERIKSVKSYFQKKYNTTNVNVLTRAKISDQKDESIDVSANILDKNYQRELLKDFLKSKNYDNNLDDVLKIDNSVDNKLIQENPEITTFKKWFIRKVEFSNFLCFGDNQKIDYDQHNGITIIESNPPNFGGKTTAVVDLLLFLFFNQTTKTSKAEEIFNRFTTKDKVSVTGEITIDGEDYIIVRNIERKKSKSGEWNVKTELDFFKKMSDGTLQNFTGEQRRETENFIKSSIGSVEDFLMTILTTSTNLEDLLESKPTARGQILGKFLGLEVLRKKEEIAKEFYSDFSKKMYSNVYNRETLKNEIDQGNIDIIDFKDKILDCNTKISDAEDRLKKGTEYKEDLLNKKYADIDQQLLILNVDDLKNQITDSEGKIQTNTKLMNEVKVIEPSSFYHEEDHDKVKEEYNEIYKKHVQVENKIGELNKLKSSVSSGIKCEHCGIELMNAAITQAKLSELDGFIVQSQQFNGLMSDLSDKEKSFTQLKKEFDEYEKNKLIREKYEVTIESLELKKQQLEDKLDRYNRDQVKILKNKQIDEQILKAKVRIEQIEQEKNSLIQDKAKNELSIKTLEEKIKKNKDLIQKIEEESEKEKIYKIYLECYGKNGISKLILKTMLPFINSELERLLQDSAMFKLDIRVSDKNEVEFWMIDNNTGIEKLMVSGSGYERTIASLALRAVLSKVCSLPKPNIIVMDEVFGKISNENLDMVGEFFNKIRDYFEKIIIVTHNPLVSQWASNVIKIKKVDNVSFIQ